MKKSIELSESLEDYLEVILNLEKTNKVARAKDIAEQLDIKRGSVTGSLKSLEKKGLINYTPYSFITLTPNGLKIAREIARRHSILKDFLFKVLQVDPDTAEATACRMEHAIDAKSLERLIRFIDYIHTCPLTGQEWLESFINYCSSGARNREKCDQCLEDCNIRYQGSKLPPA